VTPFESLGVFAAEVFLILLALVILIIVITVAATRSQSKSDIKVELLHKKYKSLARTLKDVTMNKAERKAEKKKLKAEKNQEEPKRKLYVIDFEGDIKASAVENLREEISAVLGVATSADEVVVRVDSPGGMVNGYGLAAAQLIRIREKGIPLTITVDKVAASGGYMMACTANKILCAPFTIVGSIGVVAALPNFNRFLKDHDVDYKEYTAGEYKRTVSIFGEITEKGEEKFREQLEATHVLFKSFVHKYRPQLDVAKVATGEYWYGEQAIHLNLIDDIKTSDEYLMTHALTSQVVKITFERKTSLGERMSGLLGKSLKQAGTSLIEDLEARRWV
jgi:serine protease SohB